MTTAALKTYIDRRLFWSSVLLGLMLLPSLLRWFIRPFVLIDYDLDFFLGLVASEKWSPASVQLTGWFVHAAGWFAMAWMYLQTLLVLRRNCPGPELSWLLPRLAFLACLYLAGLPYFSPDVFFYLGKGWLDFAYGIEPFTHSISVVPDFQSVAMFKNIAPVFFITPGNYGDLFHWITRQVAFLCGGNQIVALVIFKVFALLCHLCSLFAVVGIARKIHLNVSAALWGFGANPLFLFTTLWGAHNDVFMLPCVLFAAWMALAHRPALCGIFLGAGFCMKLVPILMLPFLGLWFLRTGKKPLGSCLLLGAAFFISVAAFNSLNGAGLAPYSWMAMNNPYGVIRSCSIILFGPFLLLLGPDCFALVPTAFKVLLCLASAGVGWRFWKNLGTAAPSLKPLLLLRTLAWPFCFYLAVVSPMITEWYLLWFLTFWVLFARQRELQSIKTLTMLYVPLVIFCMYPLTPGSNSAVTMALAQFLAYLLVLFVLLRTSCSPRYFSVRSYFQPWRLFPVLGFLRQPAK